MTDDFNKVSGLVSWLNARTKEYEEGHPTVSDAEWDKKYFELKVLEDNSGIIFPNSPTQRVLPMGQTYQIVDKLEKVEHNHPMLSLDKTKDLFDVLTFLNDQDYVAMAKMDGLTCSLRYVDGKLTSAETRGDGVVGENIFHNALVVNNIPKKIDYKDELIVDGEIISTYDNFNNFAGWFKNPRNFAAGSIRLLNSQECAKRNLKFIAWDMIKGFEDLELFSNRLQKLEELGFEVVPTSFSFNIQEVIDNIKDQARVKSYPIDGIVFKFDNVEYGKSLGQTTHHFKNALAYKFYDELFSSTLEDIDWTMGRTGVLTPVAIFKPIEMDGSSVSRASLHNLSVMEELLGIPFVGQEVQVFKANMIIPQISKAERANEKPDHIIPLPEKCPICGEEVKIKVNGDVKELYCPNPNCAGKIINQFDHFVGKKGLDIKGLSKATIEKLLEWDWLHDLHDIFELHNYKMEWGKKPGFGAKSVANILNAIEQAKTTTLDKFISALGIPLIGSTVSKDICTKIKDYEEFRNKCLTHFDFMKWDGFAESKTEALWNYDFTEANKIYKYLTIIQEEKEDVSLTLNGKTIVITGRLTEFKNRNELQKAIEDRGGKVTGSISKRTDYLINNDINSDSSKNKSAKEYGIPIITEADFKAQFID
jgi:DNA ligase (NAD+)